MDNSNKQQVPRTHHENTCPLSSSTSGSPSTTSSTMKQAEACPNHKAAESNNTSLVQQTSSQFFNFVRLMQLFPDVHPATLHTVLNLSNHDFFAAVDKLLFAKRCKELHDSRRIHRRCYHPYCLDCPNAHNKGCSRNVNVCCQESPKAAEIRKTDKKKEKGDAVSDLKQNKSLGTSDLTPVAPPTLPNGPLSPIPISNVNEPQDLPARNTQ